MRVRRLPELRLERVPADDRQAFHALLDQYLAEMSQYEGALQPSADGTLDYPLFEQYWAMANRLPFWIMSGDSHAGLCLLSDNSIRWVISEFYVSPPYRRVGAGTQAVELVKDYCRAAGNHEEIEAWVLKPNAAAVAFWQSCGFELTGALGAAERRRYRLRP